MDEEFHLSFVIVQLSFVIAGEISIQRPMNIANEHRRISGQ